MFSLRPHKKFDFVKLWKPGFILSGVLIALAIVGLIVSYSMTGTPLRLGTEFSGGTSIQIANAQGASEADVRDSFAAASKELNYELDITSVQTADSGFIIRTTDTSSNEVSQIMDKVEESLGISVDDVQVNTIGASWGATVVGSSILAFILSCVGILIIITFRYRDWRMGVVALVTLFHDLLIVMGVYAWGGAFLGLEITSDTIAALLAIVGYSLYDTIVVFHRIDKNASPDMKMCLRTCANKSLNEVIVRSVNTSITSILPVFCLLVLGTDTLVDFAAAMFAGMIVGVYSTIAISAPVYTLWKERSDVFQKLARKYPYEVIQSPYTKEMMKADRKRKADVVADAA